MGAAKAKDNVFGAICYCPITDLDPADMDKPELYAMYDSGFKDLSAWTVASLTSWLLGKRFGIFSKFQFGAVG